MEKIVSEKSPIDDFKSRALSRFIKLNHGNVQKVMDHVRPKSEVKLIKAHLLLQSLSRSNLSDRHQSDLPDKLYKEYKKVCVEGVEAVYYYPVQNPFAIYYDVLRENESVCV